MSRLPGPVIASYFLSGGMLLLILQQGLLAALLSGLLVFALVHLLAPRLGKSIDSQQARMMAVALLSGLIVLLLSAAIWGGVSYILSDAGDPQKLLQRLADIIESSREQIPPWLRDHLPQGAEPLRQMIIAWLREHAGEARLMGAIASRIVVHLLVGMVIGAMAALYDTTSPHRYLPLAAALHARVANLHDAFRRIVFAQVRIAALNAFFTGLFLFAALPLADIHLPLRKSLVAITFIVGLLPVIGNLISNTVIVVIALSHSLHTAVAALVFLIAIHKLEYFLNAKIIGSHIGSRAWELLAAMLVMESVFGLPGVIAAPVFYAYLKKELADRMLV